MSERDYLDVILLDSNGTSAVLYIVVHVISIGHYSVYLFSVLRFSFTLQEINK